MSFLAPFYLLAGLAGGGVSCGDFYLFFFEIAVGEGEKVYSSLGE